MKIDVLTLFPEMFTGVFESSILGKAREKGVITLQAINFRKFSQNKHKTVDDAPYGGGGGMVLKPEPIFSAVEHVTATAASAQPRVIMMCPQGVPYTQEKAIELSAEDHLVFLCGHYEGFDERIRKHLVTDEISIGDYVLTGGEIPAMAVIDSVVRLLPGVLGNERSAEFDSFSDGLLEYPHYTRPAEFRGWEVPDVLLSGHHEKVGQWRREKSLLRTLKRRPELLEHAKLTQADKEWLSKLE